jgi:cytoplasmic iron level regulating protein YaaA (DUF328/UPF0246 family)
MTLSPAKIMNFDAVQLPEKQTTPVFEKEAQELIGELSRFPAEKLAKLMAINPKQAFEAYQHIRAFEIDRTPQKPAVYTYNGIAFRGLDAGTLMPEDINYAQERLVIFSGLYGALRPLDRIKPYRLEMQTLLENNCGKSLYDFWTGRLTAYLQDRLQSDDKIWLNLASAEYAKAINRKTLPADVRIITPDFKQQTAAGYRQVVVHTKKARGMMARFALQHRITEIEHLKAFDSEGYTFSAGLSKEDNWVFVR